MLIKNCFILYCATVLQAIMIHKHTSFIVTGAILVATVATMTLYNVYVVNAQLAHVPNMTKTIPNMTKTITSGLGNMNKAMNMTVPSARMLSIYALLQVSCI
jgi:hypothetical protein